MGFFTKSKEEKEQKKQEKQAKIEASTMFMGETMQAIGKIPAGKCVTLSLKPSDQVLNIHYDKTDITLPYERIKGFRIEDEVTLSKSGSGLGGAIVGGVLFGGAGAIVGQNAKKGKTDVKWVGTLSYEDKEGNLQSLSFIQWGFTSYYEGVNKNLVATQFESTVNEIISRYNADVTEL